MLNIPPAEFLKATKGNEFSAFGPDGLPTKDLKGEDVGKGPLKKLKKILDKHSTDYEKQQKRCVVVYLEISAKLPFTTARS